MHEPRASPLLGACLVFPGYLTGKVPPTVVTAVGESVVANLKDGTAIRIGDTALAEGVYGMVSFRIPTLPGPLTGATITLYYYKSVGQNPLAAKTLWSAGKPATVKVQFVSPSNQHRAVGTVKSVLSGVVAMPHRVRIFRGVLTIGHVPCCTIGSFSACVQ